MEEVSKTMLTFLFCISTLLPCIYSRTGNHHHKHQHHQHKSSSIALPPSPDSHIPDDLSPSISPAPSPFSDNIFNVRSFGAVGDGVADDTEAFKTAWVSACEASPAVVLVPAGFTFMIQSIIFTGPCQNGIVLQVINQSEKKKSF